MLSEIELAELLHDMESDRVERKESASSMDKINQTVCAFANDLPNNNLPSVIFVGVTDDGKPASLPVDDKLLLRLGNISGDGLISPFPS